MVLDTYKSRVEPAVLMYLLDRSKELADLSSECLPEEEGCPDSER